MKILVTGGAGYIGSVACERLLREGHDVLVLDNLSTGHREAVPPQAGFVDADLRDRAAVRRALAGHDLDAVMHFAAASLVGESMEDPGKYFENNVGASVNLLEEAGARGARRFVLSSTAATYGEPDRVPITEEAATAPTNPYGESKLMIERILDWYGRLRDWRWISLRYFNAAGASEERGEDRDHETHLVPLVLRAAVQGGEIRIFGDDYPTPDGTCVRDYIHIEDLADAHVRALDAMGRGVSGVFNLGNGKGFSVREVVTVAEQVVGRPIGQVVAPRRPGDPATLIASSDRAREVLGWTPAHTDLRSIVESAWRWHRAHPNGYRG
ncbi:MAG: UDP-glucose 4-epimerase GalE [Gemmatimonadetes bacterium]|nr:UDP-glucose 4-epimerase GalE [Gemmatimonadota bacterium]